MTAHRFVPDGPPDWGRRPHCITCGLERHPIPQPRDPIKAEQQQKESR